MNVRRAPWEIQSPADAANSNSTCLCRFNVSYFIADVQTLLCWDAELFECSTDPAFFSKQLGGAADIAEQGICAIVLETLQDVGGGIR